MNFPFFCKAADPLTVGAPAPVVAIQDQDGNPFDLAAAYQKGTVLLYFYPKANTPGCTAQACSLRDDFAGLSGLGIQIVGASKDTPVSQKKFQEQYGLPFPLLADEKRELADAFGVGSTFGFSSRTSFLIQNGKIAWIAPKAKTKDHAAEVAAALKQLSLPTAEK